jgi:Flp pilus assembly protein TadD
MNKPKASKKKAKDSTGITVEKLFGRALDASLQRHPEIAVPALEEVLQRDPYHAQARHLLGAEYAQAGKIDGALLEMATALEINPDMPLARFQLGLLLMTCARVEDAAKVWVPLDSLGNEHILNRFRAGMMQMVQGHFEAAHQVLAAAMAENSELPALNHQLAVVIGAIAAIGTPDEKKEEEQAEDPNAQHILVSSYVQSPDVH